MPIALVVLLVGFLSPATGSAQDAGLAPQATASAPLVYRRTRVETRPAEVDASRAATLSMDRRSHEGLEERPGNTLAGGVVVDLKGRFGSLLVAEAGADGMPRAMCIEHPQLSVTP